MWNEEQQMLPLENTIMGQRFRAKGVEEDIGRHRVLKANGILGAKPSVITF